ncbi:hypothetical protein [Qipengyuania gelatinilytica]|uniref:Uncharacterized protein n=1 Tax=Qipengyuania gelatinilytica TaxID=2867231 RepID=A0ABX9A177_9SPHN|nr:hypothetical protein [Qipengyuania gelatinilytica]QZD95031.1 hypothetical protein K3136_13305 [Qipengyuania gelatinilytica]
MIGPAYLKIASETFRLLRVGLLPIVLYLAVFTGGYVYFETSALSSYALYWVFALFDWGAMFLLFLELLRRSGLLASGLRAGIGTYFVLGMVTGIPIILGVFALALPGIFLLTRWLPVFPRVFIAGGSKRDALVWSWQSTERLIKPLLVAMIGPVFTMALSVAAIFHHDYVYLVDQDWDYSPRYEFVISIVSNLAMLSSIVWYTLLSISTYRFVSQIETEQQLPA